MRKQQAENTEVYSSSLVGDWSFSDNHHLWGKEYAQDCLFQVADRLRYYGMLSKTTLKAVTYIDAGFTVVRFQVKDRITGYKFVACWKLPTSYSISHFREEIAIAADHARRGLMEAKEQRWLHEVKEDCEILDPTEQVEGAIINPKGCDYEFCISGESYRLVTNSDGNPSEIINLWSGETHPRGSKMYWELLQDYAKAFGLDSNFLTS